MLSGRNGIEQKVHLNTLREKAIPAKDGTMGTDTFLEKETLHVELESDVAVWDCNNTSAHWLQLWRGEKSNKRP